MTVKELIEILKKYPEDTLLITTMCSDFTSLPEPTEVRVIPNWSNDYYAQFHPEQFQACTCTFLKHGGDHRLSGPTDQYYSYDSDYSKDRAEKQFSHHGVKCPEVVTALHFEGN